MPLTSGLFKDQLWLVGLDSFLREESRGKKGVTGYLKGTQVISEEEKRKLGQKEKSVDFCTRLALLRVKTNRKYMFWFSI